MFRLKSHKTKQKQFKVMKAILMKTHKDKILQYNKRNYSQINNCSTFQGNQKQKPNHKIPSSLRQA